MVKLLIKESSKCLGGMWYVCDLLYIIKIMHALRIAFGFYPYALIYHVFYQNCVSVECM